MFETTQKKLKYWKSQIYNEYKEKVFFFLISIKVNDKIKICIGSWSGNKGKYNYSNSNIPDEKIYNNWINDIPVNTNIIF